MGLDSSGGSFQVSRQRATLVAARANFKGSEMDRNVVTRKRGVFSIQADSIIPPNRIMDRNEHSYERRTLFMRRRPTDRWDKINTMGECVNVHIKSANKVAS